jgi:hypothetical protein
MATLVSNSMGLFEALRGGHFGMVSKVTLRGMLGLKKRICFYKTRARNGRDVFRPNEVLQMEAMMRDGS